jgi:hypothetical protein
MMASERQSQIETQDTRALAEGDIAFDEAGPRTLKEYAALVGGLRCRWCKARLRKWVEHYDHGGGWAVVGFTEKQWLYTVCTRCKYQWKLGKLGIRR